MTGRSVFDIVGDPVIDRYGFFIFNVSVLVGRGVFNQDRV